MSNAISVTSKTFEEQVAASNIPVLVDFWAAWCGPCTMLAPVVDEISEEFSGKLKVCKVNIDEEEELAVRFGIMSIPTLILFRDGAEVARSSGVQPKDALARFVGQVL